MPTQDNIDGRIVVLPMLEKLAEALVCLRDHQLAHLDLKADNILVSAQVGVKGFAKGMDR